MNGHEELIARLARRRAAKLGGLTEGGFRELEHAVKEDPDSFIDDPSDEAFALVVKALDRYEAACRDDDLLDDDAFMAARTKRLARLSSDGAAALRVDEHSLDAALISTLAQDMDADRLLTALFEMRDNQPAPAMPSSGDLWDNVTMRAHVRLQAAIARTSLDTARFRMAAREGGAALLMAPSDEVGARHTCILAHARLEDEAAFEDLDRRFGRTGDSWNHLARTLLLYKLGRMGAAKRALEGYVRLCEGGAYALLKPVLVDIYLPDRPAARPLSFAEATMAVHEADPIVVDVPDYINWAQEQRTVYFAAQSFAEKHGLDW